MPLKLIPLLLLFWAPFVQHAGTPPWSEDLSWLQGRWKGTGFQTNSNSFWSMSLVADPARNMFSIEYPSLHCGGNWKLLEFNGHSARFTEIITKNKASCVDGGTVIISRVNEKTIAFTWFDGDTPQASAFLVKEE